MNEALTITGAIFAVLTALIFNRKDVSDLKAYMKEGSTSLKAEMKESLSELRIEMRAGFSQVNERFSQVNERIDSVQADLRRMQGDINTFAIVNALHDQRIATLESAAKS
jgi:archaellum component FlaC